MTTTLRKPKLKTLFALAALLVMAPLGVSFAQNAPTPAAAPADTRIIVQEIRLKPGRADEWRALQKQIIPSLKKAGQTSRTTLQTLFGNVNDYVILRPMTNYAEFDAPLGPLASVIGQKAADALNAKMADCTESSERYIITRQGFSLAPAPDAGAIWVTQRVRPTPGQAGGALLNDFMRTDMLPVMQKAMAAGKITGWSVSNAGQGTPEAGLRYVTTYYANMAALDTNLGDFVRQTLGEAADQRLTTKRAALGTQVRTTIRRRIADLSY
jgi:hypothetical protein